MVCCYRITQSGRVKNSVCVWAGKEGGKTRKGGEGYFYSNQKHVQLTLLKQGKL